MQLVFAGDELGRVGLDVGGACGAGPLVEPERGGLAGDLGLFGFGAGGGGLIAGGGDLAVLLARLGDRGVGRL